MSERPFRFSNLHSKLAIRLKPFQMRTLPRGGLVFFPQPIPRSALCHCFLICGPDCCQVFLFVPCRVLVFCC